MQVTQTVSEAKYTSWHSIIDIAAGSGLSREHWSELPIFYPSNAICPIFTVSEKKSSITIVEETWAKDIQAILMKGHPI